MDTELARTFLTVVTTGSFTTTAERLHLTQSTVSARIQALEQQLGCQLFVRGKQGAALTAAGRQFHRHAATLVRTVESARHELGVPTGFKTSLTVGGRFGLWEGLLVTWMTRFRKMAPDIAVRAQIGFEPDLMHGLVDGEIDIALMYTPESRPGLVVKPLIEDRLILVGTRADIPPSPTTPGYVFVDWGPSFRAGHSMSFPEFAGAAQTASISWLGLQLILASGGSGYFPARLVREHLDNGALHRLPGAPEFSLPSYLVYPGEPASKARDLALRSIQEAAGEVP